MGIIGFFLGLILIGYVINYVQKSAEEGKYSRFGDVFIDLGFKGCGCLVWVPVVFIILVLIAAALIRLAGHSSPEESQHSSIDPISAPTLSLDAVIDGAGIYVSQGGNTNGPFSIQSVMDALENNQFMMDDLFWNPRLSQWRPIAEFQQFMQDVQK